MFQKNNNNNKTKQKKKKKTTKKQKKQNKKNKNEHYRINEGKLADGRRDGRTDGHHAMA